MTLIRVLVADDHPIVRQGLVSLLKAEEDCRVVAEAADGQEAVERALALRPDVVVMDLGMPRLNGLEALRRIRKELPGTRVVVLTVHKEEEYILPAVQAGASGYILKDAAATELISAVRALAKGLSFFGPHAARILEERFRNPGDQTVSRFERLTAREREVFHLVVEGRSTKEIAAILKVSPKTADNHRTNVMQKLDVHNAAELVRYAAQEGLLL